MILTEAKLKQMINEELDGLLIEQSLPKINMPKMDIEDLIPKAKQMKANKGEEDLMNEGGPMLIAAMALAAPKIFMWMEKFTKKFFTDEKINKLIKNKLGRIAAKGLRSFALGFMNLFGEKLHRGYLELVKLAVTRPLSLVSRVAGGGKIPEEDQDEIAEALFIVLIAMMAFYGFVAIGTAAVKGKLAAEAGSYSIEALTSIIKVFETTEFAGAVPLALKFLETPHKH